MFTYSKAFYNLKNALQPLYDAGEASAIAHLIMEHITGLDKLQRLDKKEDILDEMQLLQFNTITEKLLAATPIQYILGKAWFMNYEFIVNEHVLIPRPETEELVDWVVRASKNATDRPHALDIGTGSGCIAISLKLALPGATVTACDVSEGAVGVARLNATTLGADVEISKIDFLQEGERASLGSFDIIASNPPYIPVTELESLHPNVRDHEPHVALFVPGNDPLLFYRLIADFGRTHLNKNGTIYCELDADHALVTNALFVEKGYNVEIRKDLSGNIRLLRATLK